MSTRASAAPVALRILSDPAYLCVVRAAAERFCLLAGFDAKMAQSIGLALDEALANVIKHGYSGHPNQPIHIDFQMRPASGYGAHPNGEPNELFICVRDYGRQVSASQIASRSLEDIRPGGLGVHIMRSVMDRVEYRKRGVAGMELRMTKRREEPSASPPAHPPVGGPVESTRQ
ncbi:MAG: ATP-binding protein [Phycisphaerae bacterium]|nr:ATP-binding protein [Phycisphaerae bacterium]